MSCQCSIYGHRGMLRRTQLPDPDDVRIGSQTGVKSVPPGERRVRPQAHLSTPSGPDLDRFADLDDLKSVRLLKLGVDRFERVRLTRTRRSGDDKDAAF